MHGYGGPLLFVWAWLQGEAAVIVGASLAAQGYWPWWAVWLVAAIPATVGHQLYFFVGRRFGERAIARLPARFADAIARARSAVRAHDGRVMLAMRFAYGVRLPLPILCGASGIAPARFFRYNLGTGLAWALLFTGVGYAFGAAATPVFHRLEHYATWVLASSVALALGVHLLLQRWGKRLT